MTNQLCRTLAIGLLGAGTTLAGFAQTPTPDQIVSQHYPSARLAPEEEADKRQCFQVRNVDGQGMPTTIVAGYTDLNRAVLRVLTRNAEGQFTPTYESSATPPLIGARCEITLLDVDGDGQRDVFLELALGRRGSGWIFRWGSGGLENFTPLDTGAGTSLSELSDASFFDVRHDGTLQIVGIRADPPDEENERIAAAPLMYRLGAGGYEIDRPVLLAARIMPGDPDLVRNPEFSLAANSDGPYVLRFINGDAEDLHRVTGGTITLNGAAIAGGGQINDQVEFLDIPLGSSLLVDNALDVQLQGASDAYAIIIIEETDTQAAVPAIPRWRFPNTVTLVSPPLALGATARQAQDRRIFHRLEAGGAMMERDYTRALSEYRQMLALDSADREALAGVGLALLNLRRFSEAATALEAVEARVKAHEDSLIHLDLAVAYFALGQDARAEALIRRRLTPGEVVPALEKLRERARRLRSSR